MTSRTKLPHRVIAESGGICANGAELTEKFPKKYHSHWRRRGGFTVRGGNAAQEPSLTFRIRRISRIRPRGLGSMSFPSESNYRATHLTSACRIYR
jgi:hypothetical protein